MRGADSQPLEVSPKCSVIVKGTELRRVRTEAGLTIRQLAAEARVSTTTISRVESGDRKCLRVETLDAIARALAVPTKALAAGAVPDRQTIDEPRFELFPEKLARIRTARMLRNIDLARSTGLSETHIGRLQWRSHRRSLTQRQAQDIARALGVTPDAFCGGSFVRAPRIARTRMVEVAWEQIRPLRTARGLTQRRLAELCEVGTWTLRKLEFGRQHRIPEDQARCLADALGVPPSRLIKQKRYVTNESRRKDSAHAVLDGAMVKWLRTQQGLTQQQLADRVSFHGSHISRIERGPRVVSMDRVEALAATLGIAPSDLVIEWVPTRSYNIQHKVRLNGQLLRDLRVSEAKTTRQVANMLHLCPSAYTNIELDAVHSTERAIAEKLAETYALTLEDIQSPPIKPPPHFGVG
jgi:transcriptional regulator with XRE-family HTH domain